MRAFVAVEIAAQLGEAADAVGSAPPHLTLAFLGEIDESRTAEVERAVATAAAGAVPFRIVLEGSGAFPDRERPRIVFATISEGAAPLIALAGRIRVELDRASVPYDKRPFAPHLTLFRVRRPQDVRPAQELLARTAALRFGEQTVRTVLVKSSTLTPRGPIHRTIATCPLGASTA